MKHTPGPWALGGPEGDKSGTQGYVYCDNALGSAVAICFGDKLGYLVFSREEEIANATLIAAAPDMLAALIGLDEAFCSINEFSTKEERHDARLKLIAARAAVAKAKGEVPA